MASFYLDEHIGEAFAAPLQSLGHDVLSTHRAGNKGLSDPRQLLFAGWQSRIMVTFNTRHFAMLHEMLILSGFQTSSPGQTMHAGIALLPSSSRVAADRLVAALDQLPRIVDDCSYRCFRWIPATGWEEVIVPPFVSP